MNWLADRIAIITGAGSGIGEAITRRFVEEGARVVAMDISLERARKVQEEIGEKVIALQGDVRAWEDQEKAVATAVSEWGRLDVYVGNAGVHDGGRRLADLASEDLQRGLDEIMGINVGGYLLGAKAALPELRKTHGNIIFSLSTSSFHVGGGGGSLYAASKHAALGVMRALAYELAPDIRVNGVAPAGTPTNMAVAPVLGGDAASAMSASKGLLSARNLLEISLRPDDHAGAYVFLASEYARAITGAVIGTDAGRGIARSK